MRQVQSSLEDLNYHCEDMSILGVLPRSSKLRKKIRYHIEDF